MDDLPRIYTPSYLQAKKRGNKYQLFWRGTLNEVFPGELFNTPGEGKLKLKAKIIKQNAREDMYIKQKAKEATK